MGKQLNVVVAAQVRLSHLNVCRKLQSLNNAIIYFGSCGVITCCKTFRDAQLDFFSKAHEGGMGHHKIVPAHLLIWALFGPPRRYNCYLNSMGRHKRAE